MRLAWLSLLACTACSTYVHHRAALVPHATPVQSIGQPNDWRVAASLGASNIADLGAPREGSDANAGVAVPAKQLRGTLALGVTRNFTFAYAVEDGLASSAQPIKDTLPPLDGRSLVGMGPNLTYSIDTGSPWRVAVSLEARGWRVPWVEYTTCASYCSDPLTIVTREYSTVFTGAVGVVPSYRVDAWTFFGGVTAKNHPTIREKETSWGFPTEVDEGPLNAIVHAGVAYDAAERVRFLAELHHTVTDDPVAYAPALGFALELGLGSRVP
jgi:hypothetical protein